LNVSAKDNATGKDAKITITSSSGLSKEEVERMAKDAEAHAAEDKEAKEKIEARNQLDSMVYNVEKMLKDGGEKVDAADKGEVESALADAKTTLTGDPSTTELTASRERLTTASPNAAGSTAPTDGDAAAAGTADEAKKDEGVIDAEYVDSAK
jgi:molecular chaperone DnaK